MRSLSQKINIAAALTELDSLEQSLPPPRTPASFRELVDQNRDRISALIARGWSADEVLARIATAAGVEINTRTARTYLRRPTTSPSTPAKRGPGRPRRMEGEA